MSKPENYRQCELTRSYVGAIQSYVAWLPTRFAVRGKVVRIKVNGQSGDWTVTKVYDIVRAREQLDVERGAQRDVADVLEPHQ